MQRIPNHPTVSVTARKSARGFYQLFYIGTRNEVFEGEQFRSAHEARAYFKAIWLKMALAQDREGFSPSDFFK